MNIKRAELSPLRNGHFSHIFVDEACHMTEPETLVPLTLCPSASKVVLVGDPKQLGPVIMSAAARGYGMSKSLLERLMFDVELYQRDIVSGHGRVFGDQRRKY